MNDQARQSDQALTPRPDVKGRQQQEQDQQQAAPDTSAIPPESQRIPGAINWNAA